MKCLNQGPKKDSLPDLNVKAILWVNAFNALKALNTGPTSILWKQDFSFAVLIYNERMSPNVKFQICKNTQPIAALCLLSNV